MGADYSFEFNSIETEPPHNNLFLGGVKILLSKKYMIDMIWLTVTKLSKVFHFQKILCENCQFLNFALVFILNRTEFDRALGNRRKIWNS